MTETPYTWASPGGLYVVPSDFRQKFLVDFPDYRIRWSLDKSQWQIEQRCGRGALPPIQIDEQDDSLIRARDGYWLVMTFQPGDRMACPVDGTTMQVAHRKSAESTCPTCRSKGRDGRIMAAYWPFGEALLARLKETDPLRGGIQRARDQADRHNQAILDEAERKRKDIATMDAVDYRWVSGIGSSNGRRRQVDSSTFQ